ncbi:UrcA family protein [Croceicoccus sediminis]|uniref:UrcA family protein n=1 Tax=Croceicoccus sediminis TaxID=2571150 RepID=UPI00147885B9|nr:UrcA family protein [Croceicoccus sediminis]
MYKNKAFIAIIAAGVAVTGFTTAAHAEPATRTIEIHTWAFDLTSDEGVKDLRNSVRRAARQVCEAKELRGAGVMALVRKCMADTMDRTEVQVAAAIDSRNNLPVMVAVDPAKAPRSPAR